MANVGDRDRMTADLTAARAALDAALSDVPNELPGELSSVEAGLANVRDGLIAHRRASPGYPQIPELLEKTTLCLSLVLGMEDPQGKAKEEILDQARTLIDELLVGVSALPAGEVSPAHPDTESAERPRPASEVSRSVGVREQIASASEQGISRRTALTMFLGVGGGAAALVAGVPVVLTALSPAFVSREPAWQPLGRLDRFPIGEVTDAIAEVPRDDWAKGLRAKLVYVWRPVGHDEPVVFSRVCTDVGCPVNYDRGSACFLCPCHGGIFTQDGTPIHGPPPRPLYRYAVRVRDEILEIDLNSLPPQT